MPGTGQEGSADGPRLSASFNGTVGIITDSEDNIYIVQARGHVICKIDTNGQVSTLAGVVGNSGLQNGPSLSAKFNEPHGICFRADGSLVVADKGNHVIRAISPDFLNVTTIAGTGKAGATNHLLGLNASFNSPIGIACDSGASIYVADFNNRLVQRILIIDTKD